jgi:diacylglycerol kinase (ATP)
MTKKILVAVNPASGDSEPDYETIARVFEEYDVEWERRETEEAGDAKQFATEAVEAEMDVVVAYGGDGTVAEVASALLGTETAMAIFPGGTANVVSMELGIPNDVAEAAHLACVRDSQVIKMDVGQVNDDYFLLRVGMGYEARLIKDAEREEKDRFGFAAYLMSAVKNLTENDVAEYRIRVDGEEVTCRGVACIIANAGSLGIAGVRLGRSISVRDGLLDAVVIEAPSREALMELSQRITRDQSESEQQTMQGIREALEGVYRHWQGAEIEVEMEPLQAVHYDGEPVDSASQPIRCKVLPGQLRMIVPDDE